MNSFIYNHVSKDLVKKVFDDLYRKVDKNYHYHNLDHTKRVLEASIDIGGHYKLNDEEWKILLTACLFHDYGFIKTHENHEQIGADLCADILKDFNYSQTEISSIKSLILITKLTTDPSSTLEFIISDSDLEYLGSNDFEFLSEKLKEEWLHLGIVKSEKDFYNKQYDFLNRYKFYCSFLNDQRRKIIDQNISLAHKKLMKL